MSGGNISLYEVHGGAGGEKSLSPVGKESGQESVPRGSKASRMGKCLLVDGIPGPWTRTD